MNRNTAILFTGGAVPELQKIKQIISDAKIIVAADSGWDSALKMGITPDVYIGDLDSIEDKKSLQCLNDINKIIYKEDKDFSDTELALQFLKKNDFDKTILIGGGEGRLDHLLAIISVFRTIFRPDEWYTAKEHIALLNKKHFIKCEIGQTISIFALPSTEAIITTKGLKWELNQFELDADNFSLSNKAITNEVLLDVEYGSVLLIRVC